jgi:hypothetical protein
VTNQEYHKALATLGLTHAEQRTAATFGVSLRQCQRYAAGDAAIPGPLAKLIRLAIRLRLTATYIASIEP